MVAELGVALAHSKPKKAPGPDGLTPSYYKVFETLSRPLVSAIKSNHGGGSPSRLIHFGPTFLLSRRKGRIRCAAEITAR